MLSLAKHMYVEYPLLIVKMHLESSNNKVVLKNLDVLCDIKFILGLLCILPMLESIHALIKIA
jgi:hypothetical protein